MLEQPPLACSQFVTLFLLLALMCHGDIEASDWHYEICARQVPTLRVSDGHYEIAFIQFLGTILIKQSTHDFTFFSDFCWTKFLCSLEMVAGDTRPRRRF